jgi:SAM-dependent methyltransferase
MSTENEKSSLSAWKESAPFWAQYAKIIRTMFAPITKALVSDAEITSGQRVLDIAGGSGEPSLSIADLVAPSGSVFYTDAIHEMAMATRRSAFELNLTSLAFTQCVGEQLPFPSRSFDAVVSRLGVMLFNDPAAAIREMLRVAKPNAHVAMAVWCSSRANPFFSVVTDVVSRYVAPTPEDPDAPGAFRFAEQGKLANLVKELGGNDVNEHLLKFSLVAPIDPRQFWELRSQMSETLRTKLGTLSSDSLSQLSKDIEGAAGAYYESGRMTFPAEVWIVSGRA